MKLISLTIVLLSGFAMNLMAVPAAPYLITFAQPDGSTFQAHLKVTSISVGLKHKINRCWSKVKAVVFSNLR